MNNKGFTVVELIASFALTMIISVFLFQVLIDVKDIFVETSLKSNIIEKVGIISKNIRLNVPKKCNLTSCSGLITLTNGSGAITVNGQIFELPSGVTVASSSVSNPVCFSNNCYVTVQFDLSHANLAEDFKYKVVYFYSIS